MFRSFRPSFENLESREVFSAGPLGGLSQAAVAAHDSPVVQVSGARLDLARAVTFGVNYIGEGISTMATNPRATGEGGSQAASSRPPIGPAEMPEILPQDLYGDTLSVEEWAEWTAREHDPANGDSIFDFPGGRGRQ
jgi:hypothetical protein